MAAPLLVGKHMTSLGVFIPVISRLPAPRVPGVIGEEGVVGLGSEGGRGEGRGEGSVQRGACPDEGSCHAKPAPTALGATLGPPPTPSCAAVIFSAGMCRTCYREIEWKI